MKPNGSLKNRDLYLNKLIAFQDTEPVKVVTGIRRCGKSSLLKLMVGHLLNSGISPDQIVEMNFESYDFKDMTSDDIYNYVKSKALPNKRLYLFFDEIQRVKAWENAVNAFRVDIDCDIYLTGSNAYLLSSEYSTYLSGRCVEIRMLPLSFAEFIDFNGFEIRESAGVLGGIRKRAYDAHGESYELRELFEAYLRFGGMPGIADVGPDQEKAMILLDGIYSTVIIRDILEREKRRGQRQITDAVLLRKIILFLADNIGSSVSLSSIGNTLINEGLLDDGRKSKPGVHTVQSYVYALLESYFFYEIKRFDIKGKEYLRTLGKYYIVDIGLRNYLLGFRNRDSGHILENIVYFELLRRGYDVAIGKLADSEIDFIAFNADTKMYIQVTESMNSETVRNRELTPLKRIKDNYRKIILSVDTGLEKEFDGIESINVIDWLIDC
ncbi:MAG: ATP-binding protein [Clostridiales bacterium]|nr:ATP-binding protein [Clostridiales bacterium]